jgi:hypothetical protein
MKMLKHRTGEDISFHTVNVSFVSELESLQHMQQEKVNGTACLHAYASSFFAWLYYK